MVLLIDGDNGPGVNTRNMDQLSEADKAVIFYASDNKYYAKESNRSALTENTRCKVEFKCIAAGNCAVDLAVAMDVAVLLSSSPGTTVVLVSNDKHFGTIAKLACRQFTDSSIVKAANVLEAVNRYRILELKNLGDVYSWLTYTLGDVKGREIYNKLDALFMEKHTTTEIGSTGDASKNEVYDKWNFIRTKITSIWHSAVLTWRKPGRT